MKIANFIDLMKRYHTSLRRAYLIITAELKNQIIIKEIRLQITVKVVNNIIEYNNLILILLVFETFPRIINEDDFILSIIERAKIIKKAIIEIERLYIAR